VVIGAGPIGCMHSQVAKTKGARKVILADIDEARLKMASFTNADRFVNPTKENLTKVVKEENNNRLADQVMVAAGSGQAQVQALQLAAKRGAINFFGGLPKSQPTVTLDTNLIHYG
ncbi:MAG: alcohol dehydrogenase, partial [bacterium (Candidatus Ratteibacteria) CG23_combo_of_CG06-09_8_20_14_all_48_7]